MTVPSMPLTWRYSAGVSVFGSIRVPGSGGAPLRTLRPAPRPTCCREVDRLPPGRVPKSARNLPFPPREEALNCQDTRAELLQPTRRAEATFPKPRGCLVVTSRWQDPWTGTTHTAAADTDIDSRVHCSNDLGVLGALQVIASRKERRGSGSRRNRAAGLVSLRPGLGGRAGAVWVVRDQGVRRDSGSD